MQCDDNVTLSPEKAREVLDGIEYRRVSEGDWTEVEVFYNGQWLGLCRTDLYDDVATSSDMTRRKDPITYYRKKIKFGARITDELFCVIDRLTDG